MVFGTVRFQGREICYYLYRVYGLFDTIFPVLVIREPELIKQMTVRDFDHFLDHRPFLGDLGPIFGKSLFILAGQKWRDMRATLSPAFTASKMRQMFQLLVECADQHSQTLLARAKASQKLQPTEMKDMFSRFTNDVIATAAFGLKVCRATHVHQKICEAIGLHACFPIDL